MKVRTRIAPSPTGPQMHIGNFRTALYSYFWAKKNGGEFILRVEDTDRKRYVKGSVEGYMELFNAFGIEVNEYPSAAEIAQMDSVEFPPIDWVRNKEQYLNVNDEDYKNVYIQTKRLPLYLKYAIKLIDAGFAYLCFLTEEELKEKRESLPKYQPFRSPYRFSSDNEKNKLIDEGKPFVVRLNVEKYIEHQGNSIIEYEDLVLGKMKFDLNTVDDQVLIKSNGVPTYHLAVVVDDHNMEITHPIRGYGWLPSTPKQVMLYDMLGWGMMPFAHVTDILDPDGGKLSKRKGAVFTTEFIKMGYLPEAIINFISLVGWTPDIERNYAEKERELFSIEEIIELFDIDGISNSNPLFNRDKLLWFNKEYLRRINNKELSVRIKDWLDKYAEDKSMLEDIKNDKSLEAKLELVKERSLTLVDLVQSLQFFYKAPQDIDWEIKQLKKVDKEKIKDIRKKIKDLIASFGEDSTAWKHEEWEQGMRGIADEFEIKHGDAFMVLRVAVVGGPFSPPLFESLLILGKEEVLKRLS